MCKNGCSFAQSSIFFQNEKAHHTMISHSRKEFELLFTDNIPRGVFCEQSSQKTRELSLRSKRYFLCLSQEGSSFCAWRSALLVTERTVTGCRIYPVIEKSRILSCPSLFPYRNLYLTCLRSVFAAIIEAFCFNNELHVATHGSIFSCEGCISSIIRLECFQAIQNTLEIIFHSIFQFLDTIIIELFLTGHRVTAPLGCTCKKSLL